MAVESRWDVGLWGQALWDGVAAATVYAVRRAEVTTAASAQRQDIARAEVTAAKSAQRVDE